MKLRINNVEFARHMVEHLLPDTPLGLAAGWPGPHLLPRLTHDDLLALRSLTAQGTYVPLSPAGHMYVGGDLLMSLAEGSGVTIFERHGVDVRRASQVKKRAIYLIRDAIYHGDLALLRWLLRFRPDFDESYCRQLLRCRSLDVLAAPFDDITSDSWEVALYQLSLIDWTRSDVLANVRALQERIGGTWWPPLLKQVAISLLAARWDATGLLTIWWDQLPVAELATYFPGTFTPPSGLSPMQLERVWPSLSLRPHLPPHTLAQGLLWAADRPAVGFPIDLIMWPPELAAVVSELLPDDESGHLVREWLANLP